MFSSLRKAVWTLVWRLTGGAKLKSYTFKTNSIQQELDEIKGKDFKRHAEVCAFLDEYNRSICNISKKIRAGGRVCFVVGNRTVKGVQIPLDYFTAEMFEQNGFYHNETIVRQIPNKRMPSRNSPTNKIGVQHSTMTQEFIVILTKASK